MNIQEFVSESLKQISRGVMDARQEKGITVSPQTLRGRDNTAGGHMVDHTDYPVMLVEFDLSVAVQPKLEGEATAGLTVLGMGGRGRYFAVQH